MPDVFSEAVIVALIGFVGGVMLGLAARIGRFCTLGAVEDWLYGGQPDRLRMWALAIGVATAGTGALTLAGLLDPTQSVYLTAPFSPLASATGGLIFGMGMALAGSCGYGALARAGGGDLRAVVIVLVMAVAAYIALSGPLAALRVGLIDTTAVRVSSPGLEQMVGARFDLPGGSLGIAAGAVIGIVALVWRRRALSATKFVWGSVVGATIVLAWAGTGWVASSGFDGLPVVSHGFTAALGDSLLYLMTSSGGGLSFAVGSVTGVLAGAYIGCLIKGHFHWEACEDPRELRRQLLGAAMMGIGGVLALGCTIGQGISAMSTLSFSAPIVLLSIIAGAAIGLRLLIAGAHGLHGSEEI